MQDDNFSIKKKLSGKIVITNSRGDRMILRNLEHVRELRFFLDKFFNKLHFGKIVKRSLKNKDAPLIKTKKKKEEFV